MFYGGIRSASCNTLKTSVSQVGGAQALYCLNCKLRPPDSIHLRPPSSAQAKLLAIASYSPTTMQNHSSYSLYIQEFRVARAVVQPPSVGTELSSKMTLTSYNFVFLYSC